MNTFKKQVFIFMIILADVANSIFKQYPNLDEIFLTSDGQGFRKENDAIQHSKYLGNKEVKSFERSQRLPTKKPKGKDEENPDTDPSKDPEGDSDVDRDALLKQYAELFGKEAPGNIKTKTLQAKVNEAIAKSQEEE